MSRIKVAIIGATSTHHLNNNIKRTLTQFQRKLMIEVRNPNHHKANPRINREPFLEPTSKYANLSGLVLRCTYNKLSYPILKDSKGWYITI